MKLRKTLASLIAGALTISTMNIAVLAAQATEVDTVEELKDALAANQNIILTGNIDLNNEEWEPVSYGKHFDGGNYTISNLKINKPDTDNVGFITSLNGTFENVTFENVDVVGRENVGAIAGRAGGSASLAKNINVNGVIKVEATNNGYARAGVIVGGWAYGRYINITVDGTNPEDSYVKWTGSGDGRYVAGIVGHADDVDEYTNCVVKNLTISGGWLCGGITGPGPSDGIVSGCSVENIKMNADYSGGMFGWYYGDGTVKDCTVKNVEFTDGGTANGAIGGYDTPSGVTVSNVTIENVVNYGGAPLMSYLVAIDDGTTQKCYPTIDDAIEAIENGQAAGKEIVFLADHSFSNRESGIETNAEDVVFNLNGKTLTLGGDHVYTTDVTFKNGTIAITDEQAGTGVFWMWNHNNKLTFEDIDFVNAGDSINACGVFTSAPDNHGVIPTDDCGDFEFINCTMNLKNNTFDPEKGGNLFYFQNNTSNVKIKGGNVIIDKFVRGLQFGTYDIDDAEIKMTNMVGNGMRRAAGTITNTLFTVNGAENGIKLDSNTTLIVDGDSVITLTGASDYDLVVGANASVVVGDDAKVEAEKTNYAEGSTVEGNVISKADKVYVQFKEKTSDAAEKKVYDIVLVGANAEKINELASADLTFEFVGSPVAGAAKMNCEIAAKEGVMLTKLGNRYMFNYDGINLYEETDNAIAIGTVTVTGYGSFTFKTSDATTNAVYATEIRDNIVDEFKTAAELVINTEMEAQGEPDDGMVGKIESEIKVPTKKLTVNVSFPNAVVDNAVAYQDMKVEITGNIDGVNQTVTYDLGKDGKAMTDGSYKVVEDRVVVNNKYTVTVSGAGYRTTSYTVMMTEDKTLNFWNNVMDDAKEVEVDEVNSKAYTTFLAGDIVKDANINIYDLSAVVAYFGEVTDTTQKSDYSKYDLNRDGFVDSKDVAYVLVSWGK